MATELEPALPEIALESMELTGVADERPSELPHGTQKLVGVARALAAKPRLILLDEPAAGLDTRDYAEQDLVRMASELQLEFVAGEKGQTLAVERGLFPAS